MSKFKNAKILKKVLAMVIAGVMTVSMATTAYSVGDDSVPTWVECETDIYTQIIERFETEPQYAGAYFSGDDFFISTTDAEAFDELRKDLISTGELTGDEFIEMGFNEVKYSYSELCEMRGEVSEALGDNLVGSYTLFEDNKVVFELKNQPVRALSRGAVPSDFVVYDVVGENEYKDYATYLRGGERIELYQNGTYSSSFSYGAGIRWNNNGDYGYITAAHDTVKVGDIFRHNGVEIGYVQTVQNSAGIDVALIRRTNGNYTASDRNGKSGDVWTNHGDPVQGPQVTKLYGQYTESSGTIIKTDYEVPSHGTKNMIGMSCAGQPGDSGGAIVQLRPNGNVTFVGIVRGGYETTQSDGVRSIGTSWKLIREKYDLTLFRSVEP